MTLKGLKCSRNSLALLKDFAGGWGITFSVQLPFFQGETMSPNFRVLNSFPLGWGFSFVQYQ